MLIITENHEVKDLPTVYIDVCPGQRLIFRDGVFEGWYDPT